MNTATKAMNDDFFFTDAGLGPGKLTAAGTLRPADIFTLLGDDTERIFRATGIAQDKVCAAAVGESSVERPGKRDAYAYASYLSIPGPRWRGTRLPRSTGPSGTRANPYCSVLTIGRERG